MPFGIIGRTDLGMRQWGLGIGPREGVLLGANLGRAILHSEQWGLCGVRVQQRRDAALFPNYFGQTCFLLQADPFLRRYVYASFLCLIDTSKPLVTPAVSSTHSLVLLAWL